MRTSAVLLAAFLLIAAGCAIGGDGPEPGTTIAQAQSAPAQAAQTDAPADLPEPTPPLDEIELPDGFRIHYYASDVPRARSMALSPKGVLYVGTRKGDEVYAVLDENGDHRAERVVVIDSGLDMPNGVAWRDGALYVAENSRILRYDDIDVSIGNPPDPVVVYEDYPTDEHHGWKFIAFGPDGKLYVPVGAPCNVCEADEIYSTITRMDPDGSNMEIIAHGVRNTVGFDWHPDTGELWFTDNGRDWMGDNRPPDELNRLTEVGQHFGFPYCHGRDILDPEYGEGRSCDQFTLPQAELGPHVAALGMRFYEGEMFPEHYRGDIFIAEHGSWNRSEKIGYRVMLVEIEDGEAVSYEPFATGWLQGETAWGRPVDVQELPDGSLLVSDDAKGAIYRIVYEG
ncbi:MAG: sorbosone dehydrogenase family protein [Armatimonadia bacterium]|nr:sorbosone dehydrogenase family protein [Armatimonadia bacterium]